MKSPWTSATRRMCLTLAMMMAATCAWAEKVAEYDFRLILTKEKAEIEQIQEKLKAGADFGKMAMESSIDRNSAKEGGLIKYARASGLQSVFADELRSLKPGERSAKPRKSEFGWFVVKLESVTMKEDETAKLMQMHKERDEKMRLDREREAKAKAEYEEAKAEFEEAKAKFEACALRASRLESEDDELRRRVEMYNLGAKYNESELRADLARLKRKVSSFERECSELRYNDEIAKVCSHPAYQSQWCGYYK
ncbi:MAG TPA: peptidylprolyl isomerase [Noviherbaspirillum sp.]|nr:peptidylprolyl isomerase [Noviherbaspirillum sp.]